MGKPLTRAATLVLLLVASGCSGKATPQRATASPSPSPSASASPSPSASPTPTGPFALGTEVDLPYEGGVGAKVTAFSYKQPVAKSAPRPEQDGYEWGALDVKVCVLIDDETVSNTPWSLVYQDSTRATASSTGYGQFPKPEFPWGDQPVPKGQCVRGWITFDVPANQRPVMIQYTPGVGGYIDWRF